MGEIIYIWNVPELYPDDCFVKLADGQFASSIGLSKGETFEGSDCLKFNARCPANHLRGCSIIYSNKGVPLVAIEYMPLISELAHGYVQLIPSSIICTDGECLQYFTLNIIKLEAIIDYEKSEYITIKGTGVPFKINKVVCYRDALKHRIFARDLCYKSVIFVSSNFLNSLPEVMQRCIGKVRISDFFVP
jgi:hypothetical protein